LMVRSFVEMMRADLGIKSDNVLALQISLPRESYQDDNRKIALYEQLLARVEALPGVTKVGGINIVPFSSNDNSSTFQIVGRPPFPQGQEPDAETRVTTPAYFEAIGTALRRGRLFTAQDNAKSTRVVLINEAFANRFLPGEDPIRSEEHTSELQSRENLVCRLLLEKKKKKTQREYNKKLI